VLSLIYYLHEGLGILFALLCLPFSGLPSVVALLVISVLCGLLILWVFGRLSNQAQIRQTKERIRGHLLGVRLYQHDIGTVFRLQGRILRGILRYVWLSLPPLLILLVPLGFALIHVNRCFSYRPLAVGQSAVVTVRLDPELDPRTPFSVSGADGITVETPALRRLKDREVSWRVRAERPGTLSLEIQSGDLTYSKEVVAGTGWAPVSPIRTSQWTDLLLYPGEPPLAESGPIRAIEVTYPSGPISFLGWWETHWLVYFLIASLASVLLLKRLFGIEV
jgi:hypothetical protein